MALLTLALVTLLALVDVRGEPPLTAQPPYSVDPDSQRMVDQHHRERYFHGLNVVVKGPPWLPDTSAFNATTSFAEKDCKVMQELGLNIIRLGVMWPGVEPQRGHYDRHYLDRVAQIVRMAAAHDIHVLVDMHQDVLSETFCGEGLPIWAAEPDPRTPAFPVPVAAPLPVDGRGVPSPDDCAKLPWPSLYVTYAVGGAFQRLYSPDQALLGAWAAFWRTVAGHLRSLGAAVVGYELINEPFAGDVLRHPELLVPCVADRRNLQPAYDRVAQELRKADPDHCLFFESITWDDVCVGFTDVPGGPAWRNKSVLSYHFYRPPQVSVELDFAVIMKGLDRLQCGGMLTEFDVGQKGDHSLVEDILKKADEELQSWIGWEYKPFRHPKTGFDRSLWDADGQLDRRMANTLSRSYAQVVAGTTTRMHYDTDTRAFTLQYTVNPRVSLNETVIYLDGPSDFVVRCDPSDAVSYRARGLFTVVVTHSRLPTGATITVTVTAKSQQL